MLRRMAERRSKVTDVRLTHCLHDMVENSGSVSSRKPIRGRRMSQKIWRSGGTPVTIAISAAAIVTSGTFGTEATSDIAYCGTAAG